MIKNIRLVPILNKMLYTPKIDEYLEILNDEEVKDFVAINFSEYFKSIRRICRTCIRICTIKIF